MRRFARPCPRRALLALLWVCGCSEAPRHDANGLLHGDPSTAVESVIENVPFVPMDGDEPHNTLMLTFALGTTLADANAVLRDLDAELVGGVAGAEGDVEALLVLRTATETDDEMQGLVGDLAAEPSVAAVASDAALAPNGLPAPPTLGQPPFWTWTDPPDGANWHLEVAEVPSMWAMDAAVHKREAPVDVTVCDIGFLDHTDVDMDTLQGQPLHPHGLEVAGVIAARWGNEFGIDGVVPRAKVKPIPLWTAAQLVTTLPQILAADAPVVNMSLGYDNVGPLPMGAGPLDEEVMRNRGFQASNALKAHVATGGVLPVIVASAGDVDEAFVPEEAELNSPLTMAALEFGAGNIIVVEDLRRDSETTVRPSTSSRYNGHVSTTGSPVTTLGESNGFVVRYGTSHAAAVVSGVVAFMYAVDPTLPLPTLAQNSALDALKATSIPVPGVDEHGKPAAPRIDAFGAVLDLDRLTRTQRMLTLLCDIDDGTPDGNTRIDALTGEVVHDQDVDGDGGLGDGRVDMRDFRRFRDWMLQVRGEGALDGAADHPKRDLNLDGTVGPAADEVFPRADFNGDHRLDLTAKRTVPGAVGAEATDLEVFMKAFADADVDAADLPRLLDSGDIHLDLNQCFENTSVAIVNVSVIGAAPEFEASFTPDGAGDPVVITVPVGEYSVVVEALDGGASPLADRDEDVFVDTAGQDLVVRPNCGAGGWAATRLDVTAPQEMNDAGQILAGGGPYVLVDTDGSVTPLHVGSPQENHLHYLTETAAFAIPTIAPLVVGTETYPTPTNQTISRNGVIAGSYSVTGFNRRAFVYGGGPAGGAPTHVLGEHTDMAGYFVIGDGNGWATANNHAVNDGGTLVGSASDAQGQSPFPAVLSGNEPDYLSIPANATGGHAMFINSAGAIAGLVNVPAATPILWDGGGYRVIDVDELDDPIRPRLLADNGTLVAECQSGSCFYLLFAGADAFEKMPSQFTVEEDSGSSDYRLTYVHDMNSSGVILASALPVGAASTDPRTTLVLTPR